MCDEIRAEEEALADRIAGLVPLLAQQYFDREVAR